MEKLFLIFIVVLCALFTIYCICATCYGIYTEDYQDSIIIFLFGIAGFINFLTSIEYLKLHNNSE